MTSFLSAHCRLYRLLFLDVSLFGIFFKTSEGYKRKSKVHKINICHQTDAYTSSCYSLNSGFSARLRVHVIDAVIKCRLYPRRRCSVLCGYRGRTQQSRLAPKGFGQFTPSLNHLSPFCKCHVLHVSSLG